jgi:two-component system sensor histidine kinase KdpD
MLEEVVGAALTVCRRTLLGHTVKVRLPADLPLIQLDVVLMERLLANLFENAAKYTPPGSTLSIDAAVQQDGGERFVRVCIDDNGPGFPPGIQQTLFDKFTRGEKESAKPGVGLGLAICRAIVEAHGGKIGAENRVDGDGHVTGARFYFTLPATEAPPLDELLEEGLKSASAAEGMDRP